ncbi:hexameric tyrosine-coordinated heme protein [Tritonibacter scottomollicae]|uniref:hexameric tyrosine-coordinated heme protein n=1 Tax=Tritonibacter scottomollicae TaxID=483013 RepID=UPI003AA8AC1F
MTDTWLPSLQTPTPEEGYALAIKLSRMAVKMTQPDDAVRQQLRTIYERDAAMLTATSAIVATHFQTVAAANNYWKD